MSSGTIKTTSKAKTTFLVWILHQHGDCFGTTTGKLEAEDAEDALRKSELWIARKRSEHKCKDYGNQCAVGIREAYVSRSAAMAAYGAEEILPVNEFLDEVVLDDETMDKLDEISDMNNWQAFWHCVRKGYVWYVLPLLFKKLTDKFFRRWSW